MAVQIPATVPKTVDGYIGYLAQQIRRANDHWDHFGKAASAAYAKAYSHNEHILSSVRDIQVARKAADQAAMSFALSLLTVGVAGAAASAITKEISSKVTQDAAKDIVKQIVKTYPAPISSPAVHALSPDKAGNDVFAPSNVTPTEYMAKILEGISYRKGLLEDILDAAQWDPNTSLVKVPDDSNSNSTYVGITHWDDGQLTVSSAKLLAETILDTSYFQQMPSMQVNSDALLPKAQLALWIGWALNRDPEYWSGGDQTFDHYIIAGPGGGGGGQRLPKATSEQSDWLPVRNDLLALGVPTGLITSTLRIHVWTGDSTEIGLYMWGFMSWASSTAAMDLLLDDTVRSKDTVAVQRVYRRASRRILTSKNAPHPQWVQQPEPIVTPIE
jgi:hypothetical protein